MMGGFAPRAIRICTFFPLLKFPFLLGCQAGLAGMTQIQSPAQPNLLRACVQQGVPSTRKSQTPHNISLA